MVKCELLELPEELILFLICKTTTINILKSLIKMKSTCVYLNKLIHDNLILVKDLFINNSLKEFPLRKPCKHKLVKFSNFRYYWRALNWSIFCHHDTYLFPKYLTLLRYYTCVANLKKPILGFLHSKVIYKDKQAQKLSFWFVDIEVVDSIMNLMFTCYDLDPIHMRIRLVKTFNDKYFPILETKKSVNDIWSERKWEIFVLDFCHMCRFTYFDCNCVFNNKTLQTDCLSLIKNCYLTSRGNLEI